MLIANLFFILFFSSPQFDNSIYLFDKVSVIENDAYSEIDPFIDDLYYQDKEIRDIGKSNLLNISKKSPLFRKAVIGALIGVLKDKRLLESQKALRYQTWYDAAKLLGELNAFEAVDLLIENLDYTADKKDISLNYYPVIEVVAKITPNSLNKLSYALEENKNSLVRINAAKCLGLIHSQEAKEALLKALPIEKDLKVKEQINLELHKWSRVI